MNKYLLIYILAAFHSCFLTGQEKKHHVNEIAAFANQVYQASDVITAIAVKSQVDLGTKIEILVDGHSLSIPLDPDGLEYTYFISLPEPLHKPTISHPFDASVFLINSEEAPNINSLAYRQTNDCEFPINPIPQSVWRNGLNPPSYSRSFTDVNHVIIHHAAGSNTNTNFTQVVRDIYVYHTEVNGWSDIGYNYLIAQNGDLYAGRDPDGGQQDNVMGAHFCGRNATTMGICLLGNYETANPSNSMWTTLEQVVAFKVNREALNPLASDSHPLGNIGHIAGHRDGCSTLCPGENVYKKLTQLRQTINDNLASCEAQLSFQSSNPTINSGESIVFTNTSSGYDQYSWYFEGGTPEFAEWQTKGSVTYQNPGIYDVAIIGTIEGIADTAYYESTILVKGDLKAYPNPIAANQVLTLSEDTPIVKLEILDTKGAVCFAQELNGETQITIPSLRSGYYVMRILANGYWASEPLIIE
ncbi:MAG: N-acetylmuramoyl-L-alanine amidase [Cyclobacteriaceae bacterium]